MDDTETIMEIEDGDITGARPDIGENVGLQEHQPDQRRKRQYESCSKTGAGG